MRNRRNFIKMMGASVGIIGMQNISSTAPKEKPYNIVLILTDDQGWGSTGLMIDNKMPDSKSDFIETPNLERLAASGMRFSRGYAPHPNCSPSRCSILTGKSPAKLKMTDILGRSKGALYEGNRIIPPQHISAIPDDEITITELIKKHYQQYTTAHFGKWHLGTDGPHLHGFDDSDGKTGNKEGSSKDPDDPKQIFGITKRSSEWMEKQVKAGNPFYLQISHYATHLKIQFKESTIKKYENKKAAIRHTNIGHAAMTTDLDEGLGMTLDKINELGISDNTYIIYMADNGTYPLESKDNPNGPVRGWKATTWEGGIRVPFVISGPGIKPNSHSREMVVGYDLYPTICDWLGIKDIPKGVEGGSLKQALENDGKGRVNRAHDVLVFHFPHYQLAKGSHPSTALFHENYKLLKFYETDELRLFDMDNDTGERNNLAKKMPEKAAFLHKKLQNYLKDIDASMPKKNNDFDPEKDPGARFIEYKKMLLDPESPYPFQEGKKINRGSTKKPGKKSGKKAKKKAEKKAKNKQ